MKKPEISIIILFLVSFFVLSGLFMKFYHIGFVPGTGWIIAGSQPSYLYDEVRQSSMLIATISFFILIGLWIFVLKTKQKQYKKRLWFAFLWLFIAIFSHLLFYVSNLSYVYREHPKVFSYTSSDWEYIKDKEKYFWLIEKYWTNEKWFAKFETLKDAIDALKLADKLNDKLLYVLVFKDIGRFWYDKALEKYSNDTFRYFFISKFINSSARNSKDLKFIEDNIEYLYLFNIDWSDDIGNLIKHYEWINEKTFDEKIDILFNASWVVSDNIFSSFSINYNLIN